MLKFHRTSFRLPAELLSHCDIFQNTVITCNWRFISKLRKKTPAVLFFHEWSWEQSNSSHVHHMQLCCFDSPQIHNTMQKPQSLVPGDEPPWGLRLCRSWYWKMKKLKRAREARCTAACCSACACHGAYSFFTSWVLICWAQQKELPLEPMQEEWGGTTGLVQKGSSKDQWHQERKGGCSVTMEGKQQDWCHENCRYPRLCFSPHLLNEDNTSLRGSEEKAVSD